ncbi:unnamed protein product [Ceratitis capitata]|uniref:(Mediterranean fruit fly) hypothetical protein n=1 Tax=Ceratitis capitata TaxID=7213 RepID=A0A811V770_CERCA|nr:unnamed protein product [Ceratitis capitata]
MHCMLHTHTYIHIYLNKYVFCAFNFDRLVLPQEILHLIISPRCLFVHSPKRLLRVVGDEAIFISANSVVMVVVVLYLVVRDLLTYTNRTQFGFITFFSCFPFI